jgi:branched-chain amino acid transport system ATP-binding protein
MSLWLENLSAAYDGYPVFRDFNLRVDLSEAVGIVGLNGSGKTTVLKAVMSQTPKKWGTVISFGKNVTSLPAHELVRRGLTLIPEGRQVFNKMTVRENLEIGAYTLGKSFRVEQKLQSVMAIIPHFEDRQKQLAGSLSGGEQQLLVIARGLMSDPKTLLIDEPFLGLSPGSIELVQRTLKAINQSGVELLIAEEDPNLLTGLVTKTHRLDRSVA